MHVSSFSNNFLISFRLVPVSTGAALPFSSSSETKSPVPPMGVFGKNSSRTGALGIQLYVTVWITSIMLDFRGWDYGRILEDKRGKKDTILTTWTLFVIYPPRNMGDPSDHFGETI